MAGDLHSGTAPGNRFSQTAVRATGYTDATADVSFGTPRTPAGGPTLVLAVVATTATGGNPAEVAVDVGGTERSSVTTDTASGGLAGNPDVTTGQVVTTTVPRGGSYTLRNVTDPAVANAVSAVHELKL